MILELAAWAGCSLVIHAGLATRTWWKRKEPVVTSRLFCTECARIQGKPGSYMYEKFDPHDCQPVHARTNHLQHCIALPPDFLGPVNGCACRSCAVTRRAKVPEIDPSAA